MLLKPSPAVGEYLLKAQGAQVIPAEVTHGVNYHTLCGHPSGIVHLTSKLKGFTLELQSKNCSSHLLRSSVFKDVPASICLNDVQVISKEQE